MASRTQSYTIYAATARQQLNCPRAFVETRAPSKSSVASAEEVTRAIEQMTRDNGAIGKVEIKRNTTADATFGIGGAEVRFLVPVLAHIDDGQFRAAVIGHPPAPEPTRRFQRTISAFALGLWHGTTHTVAQLTLSNGVEISEDDFAVRRDAEELLRRVVALDAAIPAAPISGAYCRDCRLLKSGKCLPNFTASAGGKQYGALSPQKLAKLLDATASASVAHEAAREEAAHRAANGKATPGWPLKANPSRIKITKSYEYQRALHKLGLTDQEVDNCTTVSTGAAADALRKAGYGTTEANKLARDLALEHGTSVPVGPSVQRE